MNWTKSTSGEAKVNYNLKTEEVDFTTYFVLNPIMEDKVLENLFLNVLAKLSTQVFQEFSDVITKLTLARVVKAPTPCFRRLYLCTLSGMDIDAFAIHRNKSYVVYLSCISWQKLFQRLWKHWVEFLFKGQQTDQRNHLQV
jgi:hypothetical protein